METDAASTTMDKAFLNFATAHCITVASEGVFATVLFCISPTEVNAESGTVVSLAGPEYPQVTVAAPTSL